MYLTPYVKGQRIDSSVFITNAPWKHEHYKLLGSTSNFNIIETKLKQLTRYGVMNTPNLSLHLKKDKTTSHSISAEELSKRKAFCPTGIPRGEVKILKTS